MSFLEKEGEPKQSAFWDWAVGIGLVVIIGGFTLYYQFQKKSSAARFHEADSLFQAGNYPEAERKYERLKSAQYLTTQNDSIIYARMDSIETAKDREAELAVRSRTLLAAGDTTGARREAGKILRKELLQPEDSAWIDSLVR